MKEITKEQHERIFMEQRNYLSTLLNKEDMTELSYLVWTLQLYCRKGGSKDLW